MSAPKHTSGPWHYIRRLGRIEGPSGRLVCFTVGIDGDANGHLVAAVPDLLTALKASNRALINERGVLFDSVRNSAGEVDDPNDAELLAEFDALIKANETAIAKAEGGQ